MQNNWFMTVLVTASVLVLCDSSGLIVTPGLWLKKHYGPEFSIIVIFLLSGIALDMRQVRQGFADCSGTAASLVIIFVAGPLIALAFSILPLPTGVVIGMILVGVMPSTLSSGVVMTGAAGGNMAHALLITILANSLAVVTIPFTLTLFHTFTGDSQAVEIKQLPIMIKIGTLVLSPRGGNFSPK